MKLSLKELKTAWIKADKDASSGIDFDEFCDAVETLPATLQDRQQSMKALQDKLSGGKPDEDAMCTVM